MALFIFSKMKSEETSFFSFNVVNYYTHKNSLFCLCIILITPFLPLHRLRERAALDDRRRATPPAFSLGACAAATERSSVDFNSDGREGELPSFNDNNDATVCPGNFAQHTQSLTPVYAHV